MTSQQYAEFTELCEESRKVTREICRIMRLPPGQGDKAEILPGLFQKHSELHEKTKPYINLALEEFEAESQ